MDRYVTIPPGLWPAVVNWFTLADRAELDGLVQERAERDERRGPDDPSLMVVRIPGRLWTNWVAWLPGQGLRPHMLTEAWSGDTPVHRLVVTAHATSAQRARWEVALDAPLEVCPDLNLEPADRHYPWASPGTAQRVSAPSRWKRLGDWLADALIPPSAGPVRLVGVRTRVAMWLFGNEEDHEPSRMVGEGAVVQR